LLLDPVSPVRPYYEDLAKNLLSLGEDVKSVVVTSAEPNSIVDMMRAAVSSSLRWREGMRTPENAHLAPDRD